MGQRESVTDGGRENGFLFLCQRGDEEKKKSKKRKGMATEGRRERDGGRKGRGSSFAWGHGADWGSMPRRETRWD